MRGRGRSLARIAVMDRNFENGGGSRTRATEKRREGLVHSGSGMNSVSLGTCAKRPLFQSALACSILSLEEETKFHQIWRGPSSASPPRNIIRTGFVVFTVMRSPGRKIKSRGAS